MDVTTNHPLSIYHFTKSPRDYLSREEVKKALQVKVVLFEPEKIRFNLRWKTVALSIIFVSIAIGFSAFLYVANHLRQIDHSNDVPTKYKCVPSDIYSKNKVSCPINEFWIDHTKDISIPNNEEALKVFLLIVLTPIFFFMSSFKVLNVAETISTRIKNEPLIEQNKKIDQLKTKFFCSFDKVEIAPLKSSLVSDFVELKLFSDDQFKLLSFSQIKNIKKCHPDLFENLLQKQKFSTIQERYWKKLNQMINASKKELERILHKKTTSTIFSNEPKILETLIQNIKKEIFTKSILDLLITKIRLINNFLIKLNHDEISNLIDHLNSSKISIKKAYRQLYCPSSNDSREIHFQLLDKNQNQIVLKVQSDLLIKSSDIFKAMLSGKFKETDQKAIQIDDIEPEIFNDIISYLKTGIIDFETIDFSDILYVISKYGFKKMGDEIEFYLCHHVDEFYHEYELDELLSFCQVYQLHRFKQLIDMKLTEHSLPFFSSEFLNTLKLSSEYLLNENLKTLTLSVLNEIPLVLDDQRFIKRLTEAIGIYEPLLEAIFPFFSAYLEKKPHLLKDFWDQADELKINPILEKIITFCENEENEDIYLANWPIPPNLRILK